MLFAIKHESSWQKILGSGTEDSRSLTQNKCVNPYFPTSFGRTFQKRIVSNSVPLPKIFAM